MKRTCKDKVIIKNQHTTSSKKYLQFLFQYFSSSNSTEDDESYFPNQYFLFATCATHMPVLPADQHFQNLTSDDKNTFQRQTEAVLRARQLWLELPKGAAASAGSSSRLCQGHKHQLALVRVVHGCIN